MLTYTLAHSVRRQLTRGVIDFFKQVGDFDFAIGWEPAPAELAAMDPAGIIGPATQYGLIERAVQANIPFVALNNSQRPPPVPWVLTDEARLGRMAAEHLAQLGVRHFAYTGHRTWPFVPPRGLAFTAALAEMGLQPPSRFLRLYYAQGRRLEMEKHLQAWLERLPKPCGILAATDYIALEVITAARHAGLRVPDDLAVLGVDNDDIASQLSPVAISSIVQPGHTFGFEAARLLHQIWETGRSETEVLRLAPVRVVGRASTDLVAVRDADVAQAMTLIRAHAHESIDVNWICERLPISRRALERKFKQALGQTMLERIHHERFERIKQLLTDTDLQLKNIAQRTGMVNAKWLSDSFRKYVGMSPGQYRRRFRAGRRGEDDRTSGP